MELLRFNSKKTINNQRMHQFNKLKLLHKLHNRIIWVVAKWVYQIGQRTATITTITNKGTDFKKTQDLIHNKIKLANQIADSVLYPTGFDDFRCNCLFPL